MALAKKCDRCGKFYEQYTVESPNKDGKINSIETIKRDPDGTVDRVNRMYDLCPECMDSFIYWMKSYYRKETKKEGD